MTCSRASGSGSTAATLGGRSHLENFSFTSGYGHMIRDGKLAELVKPIVLAGTCFRRWTGGLQ